MVAGARLWSRLVAVVAVSFRRVIRWQADLDPAGPGRRSGQWPLGRWRSARIQPLDASLSGADRKPAAICALHRLPREAAHVTAWQQRRECSRRQTVAVGLPNVSPTASCAGTPHGTWSACLLSTSRTASFLPDQPGV